MNGMEGIKSTEGMKGTKGTEVMEGMKGNTQFHLTSSRSATQFCSAVRLCITRWLGGSLSLTIDAYRSHFVDLMVR